MIGSLNQPSNTIMYLLILECIDMGFLMCWFHTIRITRTFLWVNLFTEFVTLQQIPYLSHSIEFTVTEFILEIFALCLNIRAQYIVAMHEEIVQMIRINHNDNITV